MWHRVLSAKPEAIPSIITKVDMAKDFHLQM
jgi:hypothetical protein